MKHSVKKSSDTETCSRAQPEQGSNTVTPKITKTDVVIVGAGPTGLSMACSLASHGLDITLIDTQQHSELEEPSVDGRDIALTHTSKSILTKMGVWQYFHEDFIHPLKSAKVGNANESHWLDFQRTDDRKAPLGYLIANHNIRKMLFMRACEHKNIRFVLGQTVTSAQTSADSAKVYLSDEHCYQAQLLIAADSRFSPIRRMMGVGAKMKDFGRVMLVCNMSHNKGHQHMARELFLFGKTCAILPLSENLSSIVITVSASDSHQLMALNKIEFAQKAEVYFGQYLGEMKLETERFCYPLIGTYSNRFSGERFALVGDAAVGMHPVTAHGYNLALRSVDTLTNQVEKAINAKRDIASKQVLIKYEISHHLLAKPLYESTNTIVDLFTNDHSLAKLARKAALIVGDKLPGFKQMIVNRLIRVD